MGSTTNSTMTINVGASAPPGTYPLTIVAYNGTMTRSTPFVLVILVEVSPPSSVGFAFVIIAIGAGAAAALAGFVVALGQGSNYCRFCRSQIPRNSRFCQSCGRRLT